jgi:predicted DNA-binding transcriptional regulator AlpA
VSLEQRDRGGRKADPLELLSAQQCAELLGCHKITIWKWTAAGKFPRAIKVSDGVTRWSRISVEAWLLERAKA